MITKFDKSNASVIVQDIRAALDAVAAKHGITISIEGTVKYDSDKLEARVAAKVKPANGKSVEENNFDKFARALGVDPTAKGRVFTQGGGEFKICGIRPQAVQYPILAKRVSTGKVFKFPASVAPLKA